MSSSPGMARSRGRLHDLERLRKKYFRHVVCVIGDDLVEGSGCRETRGVGYGQHCPAVRPGGHKGIPVDPPPSTDLKQENNSLTR
jgi:hypothetical protein